uniref:Uncharacterized protein n=1 Tax=Arundo donax TaxID=35708 RepID=A0A0A8Z9I5_ARUDO
MLVLWLSSGLTAAMFLNITLDLPLLYFAMHPQ